MDSEYAAMRSTSKPLGDRIPAELIMVLGSFFATCVNVSVRFFMVPLIELVQVRFVVQWIFSLSALAARSYISGKPLRLFGPVEQVRWLILRSIAYFAFIWLWWVTLRLVPVGDASVVIKVEIFITGFAAWGMFGEKLTVRWLASCAISLVGVVLVIRPPIIFGEGASDIATDVTSNTLGWCLNLLAAAGGALISICVKFAPDAHFLEVQHVADLTVGLVLSPPLLFALGTPAELVSMNVVKAATFAAFFGCCALCLFTLSFQKGSAGRVAVMNYVEVPIAYAAQVLLFETAVHWTAVLGSVLIIGSSVAVAMEGH